MINTEVHGSTGETRHELEVLAKAPLPTRYGEFDLWVFRYGHQDGEPGECPGAEHVALLMGELEGASRALVRIHSECITSEVFGSLKCDCKDQLEAAQREISKRGIGAIIYLRQEGRGIGLANKIRAYALQAHGVDTVDANVKLGLPIDARRYDAAAAMLGRLGIESIELLTNNPAKQEALEALGVKVAARVPLVVPTNALSARYIDTKRERMRHQIPVDPAPPTKKATKKRG
jgi:GTP cyclohydrolase II